MSSLVKNTNAAFEDFKFGDMINGLYDFWRKELADVYLEALKPIMKDGTPEQKKAALNSLYLCLDYALKMLHPTMPFLTEELYQRLPHIPGTAADSICIATFPTECISFEQDGVNDQMGQLLATVKAFRSQLSALNVASNAKPSIVVGATNEDVAHMFRKESAVVGSLVKAGETLVLAPGQEPPAGCLKSFVSDDISIYVKVIGLIDIKLEMARINKRLTQLDGLKLGIHKKMDMPGYDTKIPEAVRKTNADKLAGYENEIAETKKSMAVLEKFL